MIDAKDNGMQAKGGLRSDQISGLVLIAIAVVLRVAVRRWLRIAQALEMAKVVAIEQATR